MACFSSELNVFTVTLTSLDIQTLNDDLSSRWFRFLGGELKATADETLFLELALRGYDLSKLRENTETQQPAGEIVKIV